LPGVAGEAVLVAQILEGLHLGRIEQRLGLFVEVGGNPADVVKTDAVALGNRENPIAVVGSRAADRAAG